MGIKKLLFPFGLLYALITEVRTATAAAAAATVAIAVAATGGRALASSCRRTLPLSHLS